MTSVTIFVEALIARLAIDLEAGATDSSFRPRHACDNRLGESNLQVAPNGLRGVQHGTNSVSSNLLSESVFGLRDTGLPSGTREAPPPA